MLFSSISDPGCIAEVESLNSNDVDSIDNGVGIDISSQNPLPPQGSFEIEEMPLGRNHIHGVDVVGAWRSSGLRRCHCVVPANLHKESW